MREVVTGKIHKAYLNDTFRRSAHCCGELSSLGVALAAQGFHRYESLSSAVVLMTTLIPTRSLEWRAQLTLGGDKPVIPGVAFIR
jgi:hypothetical protein